MWRVGTDAELKGKKSSLTSSSLIFFECNPQIQGPPPQSSHPVRFQDLDLVSSSWCPRCSVFVLLPDPSTFNLVRTQKFSDRIGVHSFLSDWKWFYSRTWFSLFLLKVRNFLSPQLLGLEMEMEWVRGTAGKCDVHGFVNRDSTTLPTLLGCSKSIHRLGGVVYLMFCDLQVDIEDCDCAFRLISCDGTSFTFTVCLFWGFSAHDCCASLFQPLGAQSFFLLFCCSFVSVPTPPIASTAVSGFWHGQQLETWRGTLLFTVAECLLSFHPVSST